MIHIYHNLGLGDHIICNGLVREIAKRDSVSLFCKPHNEVSVKFMYRDIDVNVVVVGSDDEIDKSLYDNILDVHFTGRLPAGIVGSFDEAFYKIAGIDPGLRWNSFYVERDLDAEQAIIDKFYFDGCNFIHDDDRHKIEVENGIRPTIGVSNNIFDFCGLIEKANEVHCFESSFMFMIDFCIQRSNLFIHRLRNLEEFNTPKMKQSWNYV